MNRTYAQGTRRPVALILALLFAPASVVFGISDEEIFRDFPFNVVNPGARALGLGGAFISLADDSTATQANPAGLTTLRRPELFAELRAQTYETSAVSTSGTVNDPFFQGDLTASAVSQPDGSLSPTFLSYVIPFKRVALGISRLESLNAQTRTSNVFAISGTEAVVAADPDTGEPIIIGTQPVDLELTADADVDASVVQYNFALAFELHRRFSLGLTAVVGTADVQGRVDNLFVDLTGGPFSQPTLDYSTRIDDTDMDLSYNVGLLWRPADWMSLGAVYRRGLQLVVEETIAATGARAQQAQNLFGASFDNVLHTPDSYGLGLSFRPSEPWTILVDAVQLEYSDLMEDYVSGLNRISFPSNRVDFTVDDGTEYHMGLERIFLTGTIPLAMRLGAWSDPDHRIRAAETTGLQEAFPAGERVNHYTAGFGMTLKQTIQIDFAADISSVNSNFVVSTIYGF